MRRAWVALGTAVVAFLLGRRLGVRAGELSMKRLNDRLTVSKIAYLRREYYRAELARRSLTTSLGTVRATNRALEDRARGIASMSRLAAEQVVRTLDDVPIGHVRNLLRAAELLSEIADARDLI